MPRRADKSTSLKRAHPRPRVGDDTDARVVRSKEAVLAATHALLSEAGLGGVSVDEVSRRSKVAKTTIYRHWPTRTALLLDACSKMGANIEVPDTGNVKDDITALVLGIAGRLQTAQWSSALPSIIDAAEHDPEIATLHAQMHTRRIAAFRTVIERGQQRGELSRREDPSIMIATILGPLFYRRWFSREALDNQFVQSIIATVLGKLRATS